jgi:hypothetical protein
MPGGKDAVWGKKTIHRSDRLPAYPIHIPSIPAGDMPPSEAIWT